MSQMLDEICQQPSLLARASPPPPRQTPERPPLIVFAARGSSDHACLYARYLFEARLGIPCSLAAPSVITRYKADLRYPAGALVVGVSQSAAAPDVAEVLQHASRKGCSTISITNAETGPVVEAAARNILLNAGEERAVAATKTFTLTLLALYNLAREFGADLPEPNLEHSAEQAADTPLAAEHAAAIADSDLAFSLGRGFHFATAHEAALKLMECALIPCKPYSLADLAHGPLALSSEGAAATVFGDVDADETSARIVAKLESTGARLLRAPHYQVPEELQPIPTAIFAQRVALEAAALLGIDPDNPRHIRKVTKTR